MKNSLALLKDYIATLPVYNSHAHQELSLDEGGFDLDKLFRNSYVTWCGEPWDDSYASRRNLLEVIRYNSYFLWTERSLQEIYGYEGPLTADLWDSLSDQIRVAHTQPGFWVDLLTRRCRYEGIVQDAYWDPGSDNGHPELFTPTFRVNSFFFGYHPGVTDHDGNNPLLLYREAEPVGNLDDYLVFVRGKIAEKVQAGCVAMKLPIAYDRGLDFDDPPYELAVSAFERLRTRPVQVDVKVFQDFLFHEVCRIASELAIPLQVHTGMGRMQRSNALWLLPAIQTNPNTRFVLLHCSSPWIQDTIALVRSCPNVYPDLSWLPQLTSSGASRMIHDLIEAGAGHKVCWGCDTWTPEESFGSLLAFRQVLASALAEKVEDGYFDLEQAFLISEQMTAGNGRNLYLNRKDT
jgi:hypothetical protein